MAEPERPDDLPEERDPHDIAVDQAEQPFLDHLIELRQRIIYGLVAVVVLFFPIYFYVNELYSWVAGPLVSQLPEGSTMIATKPASTFFTPLKLAIFAALFLGAPYTLHQVWSFISPGLYRHEKRFAVPLLASSIALFYLGIAFAYFLVFPLVFSFFISVAPTDVSVMTDIGEYLDFVLKMFLAFGIAFEIPIATMLLAWSGLATADGMAHKRPYVIIGCFVVGMLLTPPDVISQLLLAGPTWLLFELGVVMARFIERRSDDSGDSPA